MLTRSYAFGFFLVAAMVWATVLVKHLSRGTVPPGLQPVAAGWVNAGYDLKGFRFLLWLCFWTLAAIFFGVVGYYLFVSATDLGRGFK